MSNVELSIGGRPYKVACAEGEEDHVAGLGRLIDRKVSELGMAGQSEGRMFLFASLMLADEIDEARRRAGTPAGATGTPAEDGALAEQLESVAAALEKCAAALEGRLASA
jgi:cell division protein ZapA